MKFLFLIPLICFAGVSKAPNPNDNQLYFVRTDWSHSPIDHSEITKLPASKKQMVMYSDDLTRWVMSKDHPAVLKLGNSGGLYIEGPEHDAIHHMRLGKYCSTINIETQKVLENWHECAK